jgi:hypothetical protein
MKKFLLLSIALISGFILKAIEPSGTLPVIYITTQNNAEITSTETYINAAFYIDAKSSGYLLSLPKSFFFGIETSSVGT